MNLKIISENIDHYLETENNGMLLNLANKSIKYIRKVQILGGTEGRYALNIALKAGIVMYKKKNYKASLKYFTEALNILNKHFDEIDVFTLVSEEFPIKIAMAKCYRKQNRNDEAKKLYEENLETSLSLVDSNNPQIDWVMRCIFSVECLIECESNIDYNISTLKRLDLLMASTQEENKKRITPLIEYIRFKCTNSIV